MPDGSTRWQRWSDRAIFDPDGRIVEYQSVGRDITERKVAEEALHKANKKLNLLSGITRHDINNQLTMLRGYLTILQKKQPDPTLTEYFGKVSSAAQRISAMIQFTKEYEEIGIHAPTWQDTRTLVDTAANQAPLGQVTVKNDLHAGSEVFADPLVVKVCYNLMDNAIRYGGKITTIRFSAEDAGDGHLIICEDDGDGIPAGEKEKIFERGFGKNTGMGLALSREILDITGIKIKETGEQGKGARFEMTVPKGAYRKQKGSP
jgi:signal transduction histidine kinase